MKKKTSLKKKAKAAVIVTTTTASLITHSVIEDPKDLFDKENELIIENAKNNKLSIKTKLVKQLYSLPTFVKLLLIVPLWIGGYSLSLLGRLLITPVILKWVLMALLAFVVVVFILHLIFPEKSLKELLTPTNFILTFVGIGLLGLALDYYQTAFPEYYKSFKLLFEFAGGLLVIIVVVCIYYQKNRRVLFIEN